MGFVQLRYILVPHWNAELLTWTNQGPFGFSVAAVKHAAGHWSTSMMPWRCVGSFMNLEPLNDKSRQCEPPKRCKHNRHPNWNNVKCRHGTRYFEPGPNKILKHIEMLFLFPYFAAFPESYLLKSLSIAEDKPHPHPGKRTPKTESSIHQCTR